MRAHRQVQPSTVLLPPGIVTDSIRVLKHYNLCLEIKSSNVASCDEASRNDWCNKVSISIPLYAAILYLMTILWYVLLFCSPLRLLLLIHLDYNSPLWQVYPLVCYFQPYHPLHLESTGSSLIWRRNTLSLRASCQNKTHSSRFICWDIMMSDYGSRLVRNKILSTCSCSSFQ